MGAVPAHEPGSLTLPLPEVGVIRQTHPCDQDSATRPLSQPSFPRTPWNAERQAVELGSRSGSAGEWSGFRGASSNGCSRNGLPANGASMPTTYNGRGSRPSPSASCGGAN